MADTTTLGYAVAVVSTVGEVVFLLLMSRRSINHVVANQQISKLIQAENIDRARKLCLASDSNTYLRSLAAAIDAGEAARSNDRAALNHAIGSAFDADAKPRGASYKRTMIGGLVASIAALAGCLTVVAVAGFGRHAASGPAVGLGAVALCVGIGFAMRIGKFDAAVANTRHHVLPMLVEGFATRPIRQG